MFKITKIALLSVPLVVGAAWSPAFAVSASGVAAGESWAREMLQLMDTDKDGRVSREEWMRFMAAEFDRLDVNHDGYLSVRELSRYPYRYHPGPHR